jgi:hypothetical protein
MFDIDVLLAPLLEVIPNCPPIGHMERRGAFAK